MIYLFLRIFIYFSFTQRKLFLFIIKIFILYPFLLSNTYNSVQANANQIWKFQRYYLVMEYYQRPVLVPPFIIFNHIIHLIKGLYRGLKNCLRNNQDQAECNHCYGLSMSLLLSAVPKSMKRLDPSLHIVQIASYE